MQTHMNQGSGRLLYGWEPVEVHPCRGASESMMPEQREQLISSSPSTHTKKILASNLRNADLNHKDCSVPRNKDDTGLSRYYA
jgi:hypothetical protein